MKISQVDIGGTLQFLFCMQRFNDINALINQDKLTEAEQHVDKIIQSIEKLSPQQQQMAYILKTYVLVHQGRLGEARQSYKVATPSDADLRFLQYLDAFMLLNAEEIQNDISQLSPEYVNEAQYILLATQLYNRKFDKIDLKINSKSKEGYKEREELTICLLKQFIKVIQNQVPDFQVVIQSLNKFITQYNFKDENNKRPKISTVLSPRIHRQHALSIISLTIQFILMQNGKEHLQKIVQLDKILPVLQEIHPRLFVLSSAQSKEQVIEQLLPLMDQPEVSAFVLKNRQFLKQTSISQQIQTAEGMILKHLIAPSKLEIPSTLSNMLLIHNINKQNPLDFSLLPAPFQIVSLLSSPNDHEKRAFLESNYPVLKLDPEMAVPLACLAIQTDSQLNLTELKLGDYPYLAYRLCKDPQAAKHFVRDIQLANTQYLTCAFLALDGYASEPIDLYLARIQKPFWESFTVNHRMQNHTDKQLWELPHVIQGAVFALNEMVFNNYNSIGESILECANVYSAVRMFESKEIALSYQAYFATALYSCHQICRSASLGQFQKLDTAQKQLFFEGMTGKCSGTNPQSNSFIYSAIFNLEDTSMGYFLEQKQVNFELLKQNPSDRKKCAKSCLVQKVPKNELFEFVMDAPVLNQTKTSFCRQALKIHVVVRVLFLRMMGVESGLEPFLATLLEENAFDNAIKLLIVERKSDEMIARVKELETKTVGNYAVEYAVLKTIAVVSGMAEVEAALAQHYGK